MDLREVVRQAEGHPRDGMRLIDRKAGGGVRRPALMAHLSPGPVFRNDPEGENENGGRCRRQWRRGVMRLSLGWMKRWMASLALS
jgi:hypothetical protein